MEKRNWKAGTCALISKTRCAASAWASSSWQISCSRSMLISRCPVSRFSRSCMAWRRMRCDWCARVCEHRTAETNALDRCTTHSPVQGLLKGTRTVGGCDGTGPQIEPLDEPSGTRRCGAGRLTSARSRSAAIDSVLNPSPNCASSASTLYRCKRSIRRVISHGMAR